MARNSFGICALATGNFILSNKKVDADARLREPILEIIDISRDLVGATVMERYSWIINWGKDSRKGSQLDKVPI